MRYFILLMLGFAILFLSCAPEVYYQVYDIESYWVKSEDDSYVIGNEDILLKYNLWGEGGQFDFYLYNKTNETIMLELSKSYLLVNDYVYYNQRVRMDNATISEDFFYDPVKNKRIVENKKREKTKMSSVVSSQVSSQISNRCGCESTLFIPPHGYVYIKGPKLLNRIYRNQNIKRYPDSQCSIVFNRKNSPLVIKHVIYYKKEDKEKKFKLDMFVKKITNMKEKKFLKKDGIVFAGEVSQDFYTMYRFYAPNSFFLKYISDNQPFTH